MIVFDIQGPYNSLNKEIFNFVGHKQNYQSKNDIFVRFHYSSSNKYHIFSNSEKLFGTDLNNVQNPNKRKRKIQY